MDSNHSQIYDVIFAGGGATGCVAAGRLAEADPSLKILILEAGPNTHEGADFVQPGRYFRNLIRGDVFTFHAANPSLAVAGRSVVVASGRAVGGGSSVNFMTYTRAAASDYDEWEDVYGNTGWGSKHLIPLLKKAETYEAEAFNETHGTSGPIKVSFAKSDANIGDEYLRVASEFDRDRPQKPTDDLNAFYSCNTYAKWARYINNKTGRRSDAAHHYVYSQATNPNLHVLDRKRVLRVIIENGQAVGVEYISDIDGQISSGIAQVVAARASKLIVLSAGAFGSPAILERSGVGSAAILEVNSIPQVVDLPGVGENYMDHNMVTVPYYASEDADTLDVLFRGSEDELEPYVKQWKEGGGGLLANDALDAGIKIRPNNDELEELGPAFERRWKTFFAAKPDKPVVVTGAFAAYTGSDPAAMDPPRKYFSMEYWSAYPVASGHVHMTSGLDPYGKLDFRLGFFEDPADIVILRWIYKKSRELARRMGFYRGEFALEHPKFAEGSAAACGAADGPVPVSAPKIVYTPHDDEAIDEYHRAYVGTAFHSCGTCAMKSRDQGGVVDERLNVYGVRNLKVVDLSIVPSNVGANMYNTAIAIGEKAAILIAQDLGISLI